MSATLAPEVAQRLERTRDFNRQLAARRLLDRETYTSLRKYVRIPVDKVEAERNARWKTLHAGLSLLATMPSMRRAVRASLGLHS